MAKKPVSYVKILPKKKIVSSGMCFAISFVVLGLIISCIVLAVKKLYVFIPIPVAIYLLLWLGSTGLSWFLYQEISIENKTLKVVHRSVVDTLGNGKTTYKIGKVVSMKDSFGDLILKVENATSQEHPFKPKSCKKLRIYECSDDAKELIKTFMEV